MILSAKPIRSCGAIFIAAATCAGCALPPPPAQPQVVTVEHSQLPPPTQTDLSLPVTEAYPKPQNSVVETGAMDDIPTSDPIKPEETH